MTYLIDTHILIWFFENHSSLSKKAAKILVNGDNTCWVSSVSLFEIAIKMNIGKLEFEKDFNKIYEWLSENRFTILGVQNSHLQHYLKLPLVHRDPFDRMLISQAQSENFTLITDDDNIKKYKVKTIF